MKNEYAFPSVPETGLGSQGMTMRDVFAAAVASGILIDPTPWATSSALVRQETGQAIARFVFGIADAMLAEREKGA